MCVVSSPLFNRGPDVVVAMVTSSARRLAAPDLGDAVVVQWRHAGLLRPSVVRAGRLLVLETRLLGPRLGVLHSDDVGAVDNGLKDVLSLG